MILSVEKQIWILWLANRILIKSVNITCIENTYSGEGPARSTLTLIFHWSNITFLSPVDISWKLPWIVVMYCRIWIVEDGIKEAAGRLCHKLRLRQVMKLIYPSGEARLSISVEIILSIGFVQVLDENFLPLLFFRFTSIGLAIFQFEVIPHLIDFWRWASRVAFLLCRAWCR